jgi:hypothetical protein
MTEFNDRAIVFNEMNLRADAQDGSFAAASESRATDSRYET